MNYKYCSDENFEDFASGRVIINKHGCSNFPVRLAQEIYCRCLNYLDNANDICIYDPCCGGGYLLTILGFLNSDSLKSIICSDVDEEVLKTARQNLKLLSISGLEERLKHLQSLYTQFKKNSHMEAITSAEKLINMLRKYEIYPDTAVFQADVTNIESLKYKNFKADIVFTDVPYGSLVSWRGNTDNAINNLLDSMIPVLKPTSVVAICSDKQQKITSAKYIRLEKQQIGKRKFEIVKLS